MRVRHQFSNPPTSRAPEKCGGGGLHCISPLNVNQMMTFLHSFICYRRMLTRGVPASRGSLLSARPPSSTSTSGTLSGSSVTFNAVINHTQRRTCCAEHGQSPPLKRRTQRALCAGETQVIVRRDARPGGQT